MSKKKSITEKQILRRARWIDGHIAKVAKHVEFLKHCADDGYDCPMAEEAGREIEEEIGTLYSSAVNVAQRVINNHKENPHA